MFGTTTSMARHKFKRFTTLATMQVKSYVPLPRHLEHWVSDNLPIKALQHTTLDTHPAMAKYRKGFGLGEREYDSAPSLPSAAKKSATNFESAIGRGPKEAGWLPAWQS